MDKYREYCVVAIQRSKYGNTYKELFRGRRQECRDFISNYCNYNDRYYLRVGVVSWDVAVRHVKGDNSCYNTVKASSILLVYEEEDLEKAINGIQSIRQKGITRRELEQKVREYITSDTHKLEDYSDIEICCESDREDAMRIMRFRTANSTIEQLESFCDAIDAGKVDYMTHGCR